MFTKKWNEKCFFVAPLIFVGLFISGCNSNPSNQPTRTNEQNKPTVITTPNSSPVNTQIIVQTPTQSVVIFDLQPLYKKNIEEIVKILGKPQNNDEPTKEQIKLGGNEWDKTFVKNDYELMVTYDAINRNVVDFFMSTNDPSGVTKDIEKLKAILNVQDSTIYTIEPVKALKDSTSYTGIIVRPKK